MSTGCFSWCHLLTRWGFKNRITETKSDEKLSENQLAIVPVTKKCASVETRVMGTKSDEKLTEKTRAVVPTTTHYITAGGKQVLTLLQSAASVIPIPLLQEAIGVALKIIEVCEEASAVDRKVKELKDRVGHLMIIIVDHVTAKNEEGSSEAVLKAVKGIEQDIKGLLSTLKTINEDLTEISLQDRWLTAFYKELNMRTLEDCMKRLSIALEKFKLANNLRDSDLLLELQTRLEKMANKVDTISEGVKHVITRVDEFHELLSRLEQPAKYTVIQQQIPLKPEIFHGRDGLVEEIVQWLIKEETSRVCILGPGGMGKTSVSLAVVESSLVQERFLHGNLVWVPCIGATSAALLLEILYTQMRVPGDKQVTLDKILSELDTSKDPRLILLDNFETPWNAPGGSQKDVEDILRKLAKLNHVAIFITMRGNYPPCNNVIKWQSKNIQPTDEEACLRIFHEINPNSKNDPDVSHLLSTLGYMPFAVTLMANLGKDAHSTVKDLLNAWSEAGPDILSDNPEQSMNRTISLSVDSDLVKRNPNALLLLAILSLLPAGTTKKNLCWWTPKLKISMILSAIATLSKAALLIENEPQNSDSPVLFVVPVVQSFMQQHGRIADEVRKQIHSSCCKFVLDHACRYYDSAFPVKSKALAAEDANIQSILFGSPTTQHTNSPDSTMEALIAFGWHRCDTKPSPQIATRIVGLAEASRIDRYIAMAIWCLGRTYHQLSDFGLSYDHLQKAYQLFDTLPGDLKLRQLSGQCGIDLAEAGGVALEDKEKAILLAQDIERKCATLSDDLIHGRSLVFVANALPWDQRGQEAVCYLDRARIMLRAVGNASNLALACQVIAWVHYREQRLLEALDAIQEAWEQAQMSDSPFIQVVISLDFGAILFSASRDAEAWNYIEIALMKASHVGNRLTAARALEYMGYGYLRRGDYQNAYGAYEAAAERFLGTIRADIERTCKDNMTRMMQKQTNPDTVVGFHRPSKDFDKSLFYPPLQVFATNVPNSSS